MQIHELTRKQLNEVDLAGPEGLVNQTKTAYQAAKQDGALGSLVKSQQSAPQGSSMLQRAKTALASNPLTSTAALAQSDFVKSMQAIKNNAAMRQVAANIQQQWEQIRKTLPAAQQPASTTSAPGYSSVKMNAPAGIPSVGGSKLPQPTVAKQPTKIAPAKLATAPTAKSTEPIVVGKGQKPLDPKNPADAALIAKIQAAEKKAVPTVTQESLQLTEAASLPQVTDWFTKAVIPQSMTGHEAEYLKNSTIQNILKGIVAAENQTNDKKRQELQAAEFLNLVSAAGVVSQQIAATQPRAAVTAGAGATAPQAAGVQAATTQLQKLAGLNATQIEAIKKIFSGAPPVRTGDTNTANFLQALGVPTS